MSKKQVRLQVGYIGDASAGVEISPVVYERPVMMVYEGSFESMDGPVTIRSTHIDLLMKNHNSLLERVKRLATGDIPLRSCPPLQLDHSTSARDTIGRLVGPLSQAHIDIEGKQCLALFGTARFLGADNVEKAKDGRYTHVSIGADLEVGVLNELSITPFPAAPNATLLSKKRMANHKGIEYQVVEVAPGEYDIFIGEKKISHHAGTADQVDAEAQRYIDEEKGETSMHEKLKKHLMEHKKLSEEQAEELSKKCLAHHMTSMSLDESKMAAHMAAADEAECKRMSDAHDEHEKKLAADKGDEEKKEEEKKLARKTEFTKLALGLRTGNSAVRLELRKATVAARLSRLRSEAKITPAEIKKLDMVAIANLDDTAMAAALATFDAREPVVRFGSLAGTNKAEAIDQITKKYRLARMEQESRLNMPMKAKEAKAQLARLADEEKKELSEVGEATEPTKGMLTKMSFEDLCKMLEDKGQHEELKKHLKHMMDHHGVDIPEHSDAQMSTLAKQQVELQNSLEQLIALASPVLGIKPEEIK